MKFARQKTRIIETRYDDDGKATQYKLNADVDWTVSKSVDCAAAKNGKHHVTLGFTTDGVLVFFGCSCDAVSEMQLDTIEGVGGKTCRQIRDEDRKQYLRVIRNNEYLYGPQKHTPGFAFNMALWQASDQVRQYRNVRNQYRSVKPHTPIVGRRLLVERRLSALARFDLDVHYDEGTGKIHAYLEPQNGYPQWQNALFYREARGGLWKHNADRNIQRSAWVSAYGHCSACEATYHAGYIKRHLETPMHAKSVRKRLDVIVETLNGYAGKGGGR